jgi:hypothetical protein
MKEVWFLTEFQDDSQCISRRIPGSLMDRVVAVVTCRSWAALHLLQLKSSYDYAESLITLLLTHQYLCAFRSIQNRCQEIRSRIQVRSTVSVIG